MICPFCSLKDPIWVPPADPTFEVLQKPEKDGSYILVCTNHQSKGMILCPRCKQNRAAKVCNLCKSCCGGCKYHKERSDEMSLHYLKVMRKYRAAKNSLEAVIEKADAMRTERDNKREALSAIRDRFGHICDEDFYAICRNGGKLILSLDQQEERLAQMDKKIRELDEVKVSLKREREEIENEINLE